jgi:hypothetical protein
MRTMIRNGDSATYLDKLACKMVNECANDGRFHNFFEDFAHGYYVLPGNPPPAGSKFFIASMDGGASAVVNASSQRGGVLSIICDDTGSMPKGINVQTGTHLTNRNPDDSGSSTKPFILEWRFAMPIAAAAVDTITLATLAPVHGFTITTDNLISCLVDGGVQTGPAVHFPVGAFARLTLDATQPGAARFYLNDVDLLNTTVDLIGHGAFHVLQMDIHKTDVGQSTSILVDYVRFTSGRAAHSTMES